MKVHGDIATAYRDFAGYARGDSPCFEQWARAVADDAEVLAWLETLPAGKSQPNLVFAAARWLGVPAPGPYAGLRRDILDDHGDALRHVIEERATQTNEVNRLATLVPALGLVGDREGGPLAILEVGTSAGLCLYPDAYDYVWTPAGHLGGSGGPILSCEVDGDVPVPTRHPDIAWRAGIDLHPLDVADTGDMAWLEGLVFPEQDQRRTRLRRAIEVARRDPPRIVAGDLFAELPALLDEAREHATPVVFHTAVAAYLVDDDRRRFHDLMMDLVRDGACHWVSNEAPNVLEAVASTGPPMPTGATRFVLGLDGQALAWTHGHGHAMTWLDPTLGGRP